MVSINTENSKQDQKTPDEFIKAVEGSFGPIKFDLAAHSTNKQHKRYFAPAVFTETLYSASAAENPLSPTRSLSYYPDVKFVRFDKKKNRAVWTHTIKNNDPEAEGLDAFKFNWSQISKETKEPGLLWLNCEWSDITPWVNRCIVEAQRGAYIALLTHLSITDWYVDCLKHGDVYQLKGRLSFDGSAPFPKDCMLTVFRPYEKGKYLSIWDWRKRELVFSHEKSSFADD